MRPIQIVLLAFFFNLLFKHKNYRFLFIFMVSLGLTFLISYINYSYFLLMSTDIWIASSCLKQWLMLWLSTTTRFLMLMNCCWVKNLVIGLKLDWLLGTHNSLSFNMKIEGGLNIFGLKELLWGNWLKYWNKKCENMIQIIGMQFKWASK